MIKVLPPKLFSCTNPLYTTGKLSELSEKSLFEKAVEESKFLLANAGNEVLVNLYALFKQATIGDNNTLAPNMLDYDGLAKYEAWMKLKGTSRKTAEKEYIKIVNSLKIKH